jgi:hypothetical protein
MKSQLERPWQFAGGAAFALFCNLAFQDYLGKERYIEHLNAHWVEFPSFMPLVWLGLAIVIFLRANYIKTKGEKEWE